MKAEIIRARSDGMRNSAWKKDRKYIFPAYDLDIEMDTNRGGSFGKLYLAPPTEKGYCHCIIPVWDNKEVIGPYINLSTADLLKLAKTLTKIAKQHPRNKPYKKPANIARR
jgi:hypothetical protein